VMFLTYQHRTGFIGLNGLSRLNNKFEIEHSKRRSLLERNLK